MGHTQSPLRYPGGKSRFAPLIADFVESNGLQDGIYVEPYAGGAGAGLQLLFSERVSRIMLNDADRRIYLFWQSILANTDDFLNLLADIPVSLTEWYRQKRIMQDAQNHSDLEVAFSIFYLNRCNRSGILSSGPIGGKSQTGTWQLDARFNKKDLARRIEKISLFASRISIHNLDAIQFIKQHVLPIATPKNRLLVYLDPPYYSKGSRLYFNHYTEEDHTELARFLNSQNTFKWIVSYDNLPQVRELYSDCSTSVVSLYHFTRMARVGQEIVIYCPDSVPPDIKDVYSQQSRRAGEPVPISSVENT